MTEDKIAVLLREYRAYCPNNSYLIDFAAKTLDERTRLLIEDHLELCPECMKIVRRLQTDDAAEFDPSYVKEAYRRGRGRIVRELEVRKGVGRRSALLSIAASLVLGMLASYLVFAPSGPPSAGSPRIFRVDGNLRAEASATEISLGEASELIGLSFFVPVESATSIHARILDSEEEQLFEGQIESFDQLGNYLLLLPERRLEPGRSYRIIASWKSESSPQSRTYSFKTVD